MSILYMHRTEIKLWTIHLKNSITYYQLCYAYHLKKHIEVKINFINQYYESLNTEWITEQIDESIPNGDVSHALTQPQQPTSFVVSAIIFFPFTAPTKFIIFIKTSFTYFSGLSNQDLK